MGPFKHRNFAAGLFVMFLFLAGGAVRGDDPPSKNVYAPTLKGTVLIQIKHARGTSLGTGWIADRGRRLVVTNHHVAGPYAHVEVYFPLYKDGKPVSEVAAYQKAPVIRGRVIETDPKRDLALVQLESLPSVVSELKLAADSSGPGDRVHSIGNPVSASLDALWVYSSGNVRAVVTNIIRYKDGQVVEARIVETSAPSTRGTAAAPSSTTPASWSRSLPALTKKEV